MRALDLSGRRFEKLVAVRRIGSRNGHALWLCRCDCGNDAKCTANALRSGNSKTCGCSWREPNKYNLQHGHRPQGKKSPTYISWQSMKNRCTNPSHEGFHRYGGRGIVFDPRWGKFENFLADMGERPEGCTLDRIDPNGNYAADNCRWATPLQQRHNRCA